MRIVRIILGLLLGFATGFIMGTIILPIFSTTSSLESFYHWIGEVANKKIEAWIRLLLLEISLPIASFFAGFLSAVIARFREVTIATVVGAALVLVDIIAFNYPFNLFKSVADSTPFPCNAYWINIFVCLFCIVFAVLGGFLARIIRFKYSNTTHND